MFSFNNGGQTAGPSFSFSGPSGSGSGVSKPWKLKICPIKPLHDVPFLLSSSSSGTLYTLRERIANVLRRYKSDLRDDHILLFISSDGMSCALVEDGDIVDFMQDGEKVEVKLDEALIGQEDSQMDERLETKMRKRKTSEEDDDVLLEANRLIQKIKTEVGTKKGRKYDEVVEEPEWPKPPVPLQSTYGGSSSQGSSSLPTQFTASTGAAAAMKAFEEKKRAMQNKKTIKKLPILDVASSDSDDSSLSDSSSSDSSSEDDDSDSEASSSSSSSSESSDSSSSDSDSTSSSESDSDEDDEASSAKTSLATTTSTSAAQNYVPPGKGLAKTQRKNQLRRERRRESMQVEKDRLFKEAKARAEKREKGEKVDEKAVEQSWMLDTKGAKPVGINPLGKQIFGVVNTDKEVILPPGGGSLGIVTHKTKEATAFSSVPRNFSKEFNNGSPGDTANLKRVQKVKKADNKPLVVKNWSRQPPPPSMRDAPIPAGIRLTSIDCDDCYNEFDEDGNLITHGEEVDQAYLAFQAKAKEALRIAKEQEERAESGGYTMADLWEGPVDYDDVVVDQNGGDWYDKRTNTKGGKVENQNEGDNRANGEVDEAMDADFDQHEVDVAENWGAAQSIFPDMPSEFGKKQNWDGHEPVVFRKASSVLREQKGDELDYGEPEDSAFRPASVHQDIKKLRDVLKVELAKKEEKKIEETAVDAARKAALASINVRKAAK